MKVRNISRNDYLRYAYCQDPRPYGVGCRKLANWRITILQEKYYLCDKHFKDFKRKEE